MALGLSGRVSVIEGSVSLLGQIADRLRYLRSSTGALLDFFCSGSQFAKLEYLFKCRRLVEQGVPFPDSWRQAVMESKKGLGESETAILASLGDTLGCADLDTQLSALHCACEMLKVKLDEARERERKWGKLYRSMGVLAGLAVVIILI